ncbi:MAG TPA: hypothetical protein VF203_14475 [Burkholderiales bacterium]
MASFRIPRLPGSDVVVRLAASEEEIEQANRLVFRNYVADGFWENDETILRTNKFLHSPARTPVVVLEDGQLVGTMSIIEDSPIGLPSDSTQGPLLRRLRSTSRRIAEVSAFAMNRSRCSHRKLVLFLMSYVLQYSFYYAGLDRLVASCKPEHATFYESVLCFSKVSDLTYYDYSHACGYLITLHLLEAHHLLWQKYPPDPVTGESLYPFLMCDPQPCHRFPAARLSRARTTNWLAHSMPKVA